MVLYLLLNFLPQKHLYSAVDHFSQKLQKISRKWWCLTRVNRRRLLFNKGMIAALTGGHGSITLWLLVNLFCCFPLTVKLSIYNRSCSPLWALVVWCLWISIYFPLGNCSRMLFTFLARHSFLFQLIHYFIQKCLLRFLLILNLKMFTRITHSISSMLFLRSWWARSIWIHVWYFCRNLSCFYFILQ